MILEYHPTSFLFLRSHFENYVAAVRDLFFVVDLGSGREEIGSINGRSLDSKVYKQDSYKSFKVAE